MLILNFLLTIYFFWILKNLILNFLLIDPKFKIMSHSYTPTSDGRKNLKNVIRFKGQVGILGLSSEYLYKITKQALKGKDTCSIGRGIIIDYPLDYDDFIRIGLLMLARPRLKEFLPRMYGRSNGRWTGIVDNWDELIHEFFYSDRMNNKQLTELLNKCMNEGILKEQEITETDQKEFETLKTQLMRVSEEHIRKVFVSVSGRVANMIIKEMEQQPEKFQNTRIMWTYETGASLIHDSEFKVFRMVDPDKKGTIMITKY